MDSPVTLKKDWILTQAAFDCLLARLDADREQAGVKYERLRLKLVKYFQWRKATDPDKPAEETLNRLARRLEEGAVIENLNAYMYGVAKLVFSEWLKESAREQEASKAAPVVDSSPPVDESESDALSACFDRCLETLTPESRYLIIEYYQDDKSQKIERRKRLATQLGISLNALCIRAHRIRDRLEACVRQCMGQDG